MSENIAQVENNLKNRMTSEYAYALLFGIDTNEGQLSLDDKAILLLIHHHFGTRPFTRVDLEQACLGNVGLSRRHLHKWIKHLIELGALRKASIRQMERGRNIIRYGYCIEVI